MLKAKNEIFIAIGLQLENPHPLSRENHGSCILVFAATSSLGT